MSERDKRVKAFEKLMRGGLSSTDVFYLKNQLMAAGFFTAPASTKYHGNYEGGLFDHSFAVTSSLLSLTKRMGLNWKRKASPYIVGMLHDLCKCDSYIHNPDGTYSYNPNILLPGHGDKSVILAQKIVDLTDEEMACIRWHMGAFDDKENWDKYGKSIEKYPNVLWTHTADMMAARFSKFKEEENGVDLEVQKLLEKADGNFAIFDSVAKAHSVLSRYDSIACSISGGRIVT